MKRSLATLIALTLLGAVVPVVALASCASAASLITLGSFEPQAAGEQIYVAVEGQNPADVFRVRRNGARCRGDNAAVRVPYTLRHDTTTSNRLSIQGTNPVSLYPPGSAQPSEADRDFVVAQDAAQNPVQSATLTLGNPQTNGPDDPALGTPSRASVFVVDDDATSTPFSFGMASYSRQESFTLGIPVFRSGLAGSPASVTFTHSGNGADPAESSDYDVLTPSPLMFAAGERVEVIEIEMEQDSLPEGDEKLILSLQGEQVGTMASTEVTIDNLTGAGSLRPAGRLHHPKHRFKYPQNYPWLREIHIFTRSADRDLTVKRAEMSIVKKMKNGSCHWWNGKRFVKQRCVDRRWFTRGIRNPAKDYFLHRIKQRLPISVGKRSDVASYEIRALWRDNRGNISKLRVGANQNRFEVIKPTKTCRNSPYNFRKCKPVRP